MSKNILLSLKKSMINDKPVWTAGALALVLLGGVAFATLHKTTEPLKVRADFAIDSVSTAATSEPLDFSDDFGLLGAAVAVASTTVTATTTATTTPSGLTLPAAPITTPKAGIISGIVTVTAATDPKAPFVRGKFHLLTSTSTQLKTLPEWNFTSMPADGKFSIALDTTKYPNDSYIIYFDYYDGASTTANRGRSQNLAVRFQNGPPIPPVTLTFPKNGTSVSGPITVIASTSPTAPVVRASFHLVPNGGTEIKADPTWRFTTVPADGNFKAVMNTALYPNGTYTIYFDYFDSLNQRGRTGNAGVTIFNNATSTPTPVELLKVTPTGETILDYYPQSRKAGLMVWAPETTDAGVKVSQFALQPSTPTTFNITWGRPDNWPDPEASIELYELKKNCFDGKDFLWLLGYRNRGTGEYYEIETTKAEMKIGTGQWVDITSGGSCGRLGQPFYLANIIKESQTIRVWGKIWNAQKSAARDFYWQNIMTPSPAVANSCWLTDATNTRPALVGQEAWWDTTGAWSIGSGTLGSDGKPTGEGVVYGRQNTNAKGIGPGWTVLDLPGSAYHGNYCMQYWWGF